MADKRRRRGRSGANDEIPDDFIFCVQTGYTEFYLFTAEKAARRYISKYIPLNPPLVRVEEVPLLNAHWSDSSISPKL